MAALDVLQPAITFIGILAASGLTVYQVRRAVAPRRSRLKHDMEILKLARELDLPREQLEKDAHQQITALYGDTPKIWNSTVLIGVLPGVFLFVAFGSWTAYLVRDKFTWWAVLTGVLAFGSIGQLIEVWEHVSGKAKRPNQSPEPTPTAVTSPAAQEPRQP